MRLSRLTAMNTALPRIERKHLVINECDLPSHQERVKEPLRKILIATLHIWDIPDTREAVRKNFRKVIDCRTAALGGEIYASDKETLVVPHTCKSRSCPSCGHRATLLWQRDRWCDLFDIPYSMVTLTMPDVLWTVFRDNRDLLHDLPSIGAQVISRWVHLRYGATLDIDVIQHTFGRHLNFNCHLHVLVSGFGLRRSESRFVPVWLDADEIMSWWRDAITLYLQEIAKLGLLQSALSIDALTAGLISQGRRKWSVHIARFKSKEQLLHYAGRYVRRPPIAQHRFLTVTDERVEFWTNDRKLKRRVKTRYQINDFVATLADHTHDHYRHSVRSFGLLAPRSIGLMRSALFLLLGQRRRERPKRLKYRNSILRSFGRDPLLDSQGNEMHRIGRVEPKRSVADNLS
jgi:hypothetical protein